MRLSLLSLAVALAGAGSFGCATTAGSASGQDRVVVAVDPQTRSSETVEVTEMVAPVVPQDPAPARRRLTQTVTLGQGTPEPIYVPGPQQGAPGPGGSNVTVNNNVTVVQQPPVTTYYYGGYGGYGRSGYGAGRDSSQGRGVTNAWAPNGWEGAGRTAAPGHTPGVGGNFAPAPSFGPRQMK